MTQQPKAVPQNRQKILLAVLGVVAVGAVYMNFFVDDTPKPVAPRPSSATAAPASTQPSLAAEPARRQAGRTLSSGEFKPRMGTARPEDRPDPSTIDPSIRLDLLAKVQSVEPAQANRNIFQYGAPPPPPAQKPVELPKNPPKIAVNVPPPPPQAPPQTAPPPAPQAPAMTFKYYGFKVSKATGLREAFLLDGDDILISGENQPIKGGRYRIIRISPSTITIEDTQFKANQTITLAEEAAPPA